MGCLSGALLEDLSHLDGGPREWSGPICWCYCSTEDAVREMLEKSWRRYTSCGFLTEQSFVREARALYAVCRLAMCILVCDYAFTLCGGIFTREIARDLQAYDFLRPMLFHPLGRRWSNDESPIAILR